VGKYVGTEKKFDKTIDKRTKGKRSREKIGVFDAKRGILKH
jgi:hypothetical protein